MTRHLLALFAVLIPLATAAPADAAGQPPYDKIAARVIAQVQPGLKMFVERVGALDWAMRAHAPKPTPASLDAVKARFHGAMDAWQAIQHLRRGPAEEDFRHQRIQFWPDKRGHIRK
jgi:predicted lipoprotein